MIRPNVEVTKHCLERYNERCAVHPVDSCAVVRAFQDTEFVVTAGRGRSLWLHPTGLLFVIIGARLVTVFDRAMGEVELSRVHNRRMRRKHPKLATKFHTIRPSIRSLRRGTHEKES